MTTDCSQCGRRAASVHVVDEQAPSDISIQFKPPARLSTMLYALCGTVADRDCNASVWKEIPCQMKKSRKMTLDFDADSNDTLRSAIHTTEAVNLALAQYDATTRFALKCPCCKQLVIPCSLCKRSLNIMEKDEMILAAVGVERYDEIKLDPSSSTPSWHVCENCSNLNIFDLDWQRELGLKSSYPLSFDEMVHVQCCSSKSAYTRHCLLEYKSAYEETGQRRGRKSRRRRMAIRKQTSLDSDSLKLDEKILNPLMLWERRLHSIYMYNKPKSDMKRIHELAVKCHDSWHICRALLRELDDSLEWHPILVDSLKLKSVNEIRKDCHQILKWQSVDGACLMGYPLLVQSMESYAQQARNESIEWFQPCLLLLGNWFQSMMRWCEAAPYERLSQYRLLFQFIREFQSHLHELMNAISTLKL